MRGKKVEGLILYKRHSGNCEVLKDARLSDSARKFYWACPCPIWVYGVLPATAEEIPRQSTGTSNIVEAEAKREAWLRDGMREATRREMKGLTIAEAISRYVASREDEHMSPKTVDQIKLTLGRLQAFCESQNAIYTSGLTADLIERFRIEALSKQKSTTKSTGMAKVRSFLKDAYRRDWIAEPLVNKIKSVKAVYEQKAPYTEEEVARILAEAERLKGGTVGYARYPKTFRLLLELMNETGMRVGDALRFDPQGSLERGDDLWCYTYFPQKQRKDERPQAHEVYLEDRLKEAIDRCQWISKSMPFHYGSSSNPAYLGNEVYERMRTIGARCEVEDCRPHRFRDTFAVRLLRKGMALEDVSKLLNHSSIAVTERYYAPWVRSRKRRLEGILAKTIRSE